MADRRVIGVDPSITGTGICYTDGSTATVVTRAGQKDNRLRVINRAVAHAAAGAHLAVVEEPIQSRQSPVGLWMASAAVRMALMDAGVPYVLVHNTRVKGYATGKGNAKKPDMAEAALERWGLTFPDDNQVDAFWLRQMALDHYGMVELGMPAAQRAWLDKVDWPEF